MSLPDQVRGALVGLLVSAVGVALIGFYVTDQTVRNWGMVIVVAAAALGLMIYLGLSIRGPGPPSAHQPRPNLTALLQEGHRLRAQLPDVTDPGFPSDNKTFNAWIARVEDWDGRVRRELQATARHRLNGYRLPIALGHGTQYEDLHAAETIHVLLIDLDARIERLEVIQATL